MREVSIFCDESGTDGGHSTYRLVTLVFHDQSQELEDLIACYERALDAEGLPHIAFHCSPIMNGGKAYRDVGIEGRRKMFARFEIFAKTLPARYRTFAYRRSEVADPGSSRAGSARTSRVSWATTWRSSRPSTG